MPYPVPNRFAADLAIEPCLLPGESVTIPCDTCEGAGKHPFKQCDEGQCVHCDEDDSSISDSDASCPGCCGDGEVTLTDDPEHCPHCSRLLTTIQLAREHMQLHSATHLSEAIAIKDMQTGLVNYNKCPHCRARWKASDGEIYRYDDGRVLTADWDDA